MSSTSPKGRDHWSSNFFDTTEGASSNKKSTNDVVADKIDKTISFLEKKIESTEEARRRKIALTNLQILNTVPQPNLNPENWSTFLKIQQFIEKYRN